MMLKFTMSLLTLSGLSLSLAACSHHNPLANPDKAKVATFLVKASQYAEQNMKLNLSPGGYVYADCMEDKSTVNCRVLYDNMVDYGQHQPGFKHLTTADLTDKAVWRTHADAYLKVQFNQL